MKIISIQLDEKLIEAAEARARSEQTTLDRQIEIWLAEYANREVRTRRYLEVIGELRGKVRVGRKLTRDEMNAR